MAIKSTQFGTASKLKGKFLGPGGCVRNHGRYGVEKDHEGPHNTTSVVKDMKSWNKQSRTIGWSGGTIAG